MIETDVADHAFLDGKLTLREPRRGHRSGTDAVLLAAAARVSAGQHVFDVGAGAGAVALALLCRVGDATATLIERDTGMAALARYNIAANGFADRAVVVEVDVLDPVACRTKLIRKADVVVSNPPFYLPGRVRASAVPQRTGSHILASGGHGDWLRQLLTLASPRGRVVMIHRPEALTALMDEVRSRAALRLRSVHPSLGAAANRMILEATPGKKTPFEILFPVVVHDAGGGFTPLAEDLHRGLAWL